MENKKFKNNKQSFFKNILIMFIFMLMVLSTVFAASAISFDLESMREDTFESISRYSFLDKTTIKEYRTEKETISNSNFPLGIKSTPPQISPTIPDIEIEKNGEYNIMIKSYGHDLETPQKMLVWTFNYDTSLLSFEFTNEKIITKPNGVQIKLFLVDEDNLKITAQPGQCGTDDVLFMVTDEDGDVDIQYVNVDVACTNTAPWIEPVIPTITTQINQPVTFTPTSYGHDLETPQDWLQWEITDINTSLFNLDFKNNVILQRHHNGLIVPIHAIDGGLAEIIPQLNACGTDDVLLTVKDEQGLSDSQWVTIDVACTNTAPWIEPIIPNIGIETNGNFRLEIQQHGHDLETKQSWLQWEVTDIDENLISVEVTQEVIFQTKPNGLVIPLYNYDTGNILFTAQPGQCGTDDVLLTVKDEQGLSDSQWVTINVACDENNTSPWIAPVIPDINLIINGTAYFTPTSYGHDLETKQSWLQWEITDINESLFTLDFENNVILQRHYNGLIVPIHAIDGGLAVFTAQPGQCGTDQVLFTVYDEEGLLDFQYVNIIIDCGPDTEVPIVIINNPENITYFNSTVPINITATDNVGIDSIWYEVNGTNYTFTNATTITLPDGTYTLIAYANDTSGNIGTANVTFTINTSSTEPDYLFINLINPINNTQTIINTNDPLQNSTFMNFTYNVSTNVDIDSCVLFIDGLNITTDSNITYLINGTETNTFENIEVFEGNHTWFVECDNIIIPLTNQLETWNFEIIINYTTSDITAPIIELIAPENNSISNNANVTFEYNVTDESNISNCSLYLNGTLNQTDNNVEVNETNNFTINYLADGSYNWFVECTDEFNNTGVSETWSFTIDTSTTPIEYIFIDLINPINDSTIIIDTYNQSQTTALLNFTYNITTNISVDNCSLILDSFEVGFDDNVSYDAVNEIPVINYFNDTIVSEGTHDWMVICNGNSLTNVSDSWNFTLNIHYIDLDLPTVTIIDPQNITYFNSTVPINITADDNIAIDSIWYNIDGGANITYTSETNITLPDGTHILYAYANDTSGNIGTANVTFTIDTSVAPIYGVDIYVCDADYQRIIDVSQTAEYSICINNTGNIQTDYNLTVNNFNGATTANVNETSITVNAGEIYQVTLSVADNTEGEYNVSVTAVVDVDSTINDTTNITTTIVEEFTIVNSTVNKTYYPLNSTDLFNNINTTWIIDSNVSSETTSEFSSEVYIVDSYIENSTITDLAGDDYAGADVYIDNCTIIDSIKIDAYCKDSTLIGANDPRSNTTGSTIINSTYDNSTIIYSYVEDSEIYNSYIDNSSIYYSYIENSTLISLYVENATILNNTIYNGTVCAADMSWCFVADENNTMDINDTTQIPAVVLSANDYTIEEGENVQFTATASGLFNLSQNLTFDWDFNGDAVIDQTTNSSTLISTINYVYNNDGTFTATVRVEDFRGTFAEDSVVITVANKDTGGSSGGSGGSGGGGGGIVVNQYYINFTEENPQTLSLMNYDTVLFDYNGERYSIIFSDFTADKVIMRVKPVGRDLEFVSGTSRYMNLDDDLMNDIGITLEAFIEENGQRYAIVTYHSLALDRELRKDTQEEDKEDETPVEKILEGIVDVVGKLSSQTSLKKPDTKTGLIVSGLVFLVGLIIFGIVKAVTKKKERMKF